MSRNINDPIIINKGKVFLQQKNELKRQNTDVNFYKRNDIQNKKQYPFYMNDIFIPIEKEINEPIIANSNKISQNCGWFFYCFNSTLYSGFPHYYKNQITDIKKTSDEIIVMMDMKNKILKFIIDNKEVSYDNIPLDNSITPTIILYDLNDSVAIINK